MSRKSHASSVTIIPVRPAADPAPAAEAEGRGLLRRTLGRNLPSRRTFGGRWPSRRTFGGRWIGSRRTLGRYLP